MAKSQLLSYIDRLASRSKSRTVKYKFLSTPFPVDKSKTANVSRHFTDAFIQSTNFLVE